MHKESQILKKEHIEVLKSKLFYMHIAHLRH